MGDIARLAGVSRMTVSLALRNQLSITEAKRKRIQALAEKHGYVVDPELSSLARAIRHRTLKDAPILGAIYFYESGDSAIFSHYTVRFHRLLSREVEKRGFRLDEFHVCRDKTTPKAQERILLARGIKGLIVGAHHPDDAFLSEFDFSAFACACPSVDQSSLLGMPSAGSNHYQGTLLALEEVWKRGYRKPALLIYTNDYLQNWRWREGAFHFFHLEKRLKRIPPLILDLWSDRKVSRWLEKYSPDVLLTPHSSTPELLKNIGVSLPQDMGFAALHLLEPEKSEIAGIDDREAAQFRAMVDLVIDQINRNVYGRQEDPTRIFISGKWVDGATLPLRR